ncbi:unnamed protein product [Larinioides sclopetarius]|uniref:Uncharacterized protein n=1 Tax=Larinioides sclopetarius TaxID=280406 RepID=A0AAV1ZLB0_9ARAC
MSESLQYCKEKYDRNQKDIILVEYEDKTHLQCCSFDGYRRCLRMVLMTESQQPCSQETQAVVEEIAARMGGVFSEEMCAEHFERCTGAPSSAVIWLMSASLTILTSSASLLLVKFL